MEDSRNKTSNILMGPGNAENNLYMNQGKVSQGNVHYGVQGNPQMYMSVGP